MIELPARATRGKRLRALLEEEEDADEEFWGQDFFQEEAKDLEYEATSEEGVDDFDSDFGDTSEEEESSVEEEEDVDKSSRKRKRKVPGVSSGKLKTSKKRTSEEIEEAKRRKEEIRHRRELELGHRKSVRASVVEKDAERLKRLEKEARIAQIHAKRPPKPSSEERRWTQEELVREAVLTEQKNKLKLQEMLMREEETKKKAMVKKSKYTGPSVKIYSKASGNTITFTHTSELPGIFRQGRTLHEKKIPMCAISGKPAKYRDPSSGKPFATVDAYQKLRAIHPLYKQCRRSSSGSAKHLASKAIDQVLFSANGFQKGRRTRRSRIHAKPVSEDLAGVEKTVA